jgi:5-methylcytosine-specific restriction endonuclease McrA
MPVMRLVNLIRRAKPLTLKEGLRILERDRYRCQYCGLDGMANFENSMVMSVDFVVPRTRGGKKTASNLVAACRPCNTLKGRREFKSFEEAKAHVLKRREEVHKDWEARMAQLRDKTANA